MGRMAIKTYKLSYWGEGPTHKWCETKLVRVEVDTGEQECFEREKFRKVVLDNEPANSNWMKCEVIDDQGRTVNTYYQLK